MGKHALTAGEEVQTMGTEAVISSCDTCDENLTKVNTPPRSRFLNAYRQRPTVARAARLAGVARCTVYRWQADPGFRDAMLAASEAYYAEGREQVLADEAARRQQRQERERERRPMRCANLAKARAARGKPWRAHSGSF